MDKRAKLRNISCLDKFLKYIFINLNFFKDFSALTVVTEWLEITKNSAQFTKASKREILYEIFMIK